jgi:hypothetical protein
MEFRDPRTTMAVMYVGLRTKTNSDILIITTRGDPNMDLSQGSLTTLNLRLRTVSSSLRTWRKILIMEEYLIKSLRFSSNLVLRQAETMECMARQWLMTTTLKNLQTLWEDVHLWESQLLTYSLTILSQCALILRDRTTWELEVWLKVVTEKKALSMSLPVLNTMLIVQSEIEQLTTVKSNMKMEPATSITVPL